MTTPAFFMPKGFDWVMPITYKDANGTPIDWTGATVGADLYAFVSPLSPPFTLTYANGGLIAYDPIHGAGTFFLSQASTINVAADCPSILSATPHLTPPGASLFRNRLVVWEINSLGQRDPIAIFPIYVYDPRTVDPSIFPTNQVGNITPAGTQGPAGAAGMDVSVITKIADAAINVHSVVKADGTGLSIASSETPSDAGSVIGIAVSGAPAGQLCQVKLSGEIVDTSWSWNAGPIFLGLSGSLTQTPPSSGFVQQVGVASSGTSIIVHIQDPIVRSNPALVITDAFGLPLTGM